jgi:predicted  nucleic acid-binding Zn-ribbon protein
MTEGVESGSEKELNNIKNIKEVIEELKKEFTRLADPIYEIPNAINKATAAADGLNKSFIGNRLRVQELMTELTNVGPEIQGLGGKFEDAGKTIESVAKASRRNVIASTQDIKELFSTSQILGKDVTTIVDSFAKVGVMYSDISEKVVESINYANSIGVNAKNVMADVVANTDQLSRFNFEGGVKGLTKMAAQASMLRFDMKQTFE